MWTLYRIKRDASTGKLNVAHSERRFPDGTPITTKYFDPQYSPDGMTLPKITMTLGNMTLGLYVNPRMRWKEEDCA